MNSGMGTQIKHQYHLCPYWVDIAFPTMKLAFEIDGPMHASSLEYDRARDERLKKLSWRTIRFELIEMPDEKQIAGIAEKIVSECDAVFRAMREQRAASRVQCPICTLEVGHEMDHEKKARMLYDHFLERHKDHPSVKRQLEKRKPESDVSA